MLSTLRLLVALALFVAGWIILFGVFLLPIILGWYLAYDQPYLNEVLASPPELTVLFRYMGIVSVALTFLAVMVHWSTPPELIVEELFPGVMFAKQGKHTYLGSKAIQIAKQAETQTPDVLVCNSSTPFVRTFSNFFGATIVMSTGTITQFDSKKIDLLLAHQIAHLRLGYASSSGFWVNLLSFTGLIDRCYTRIFNLVIKALSRMAMPLVIGALLFAPIIGAIKLARLIQMSGIWLFRNFDQLLYPFMEKVVSEEIRKYAAIDQNRDLETIHALQPALGVFGSKKSAIHAENNIVET